MTVFTDETAAERKAKKEQRKELDFAAAERKKAVNSLYETTEGRAFLSWLLENAGFFQFVASNQVISDLIKINPEAFAEMLKEQFDGRRNPDNDRRNDDAADGTDGPGEGAGYTDLLDPRNRYD